MFHPLAVPKRRGLRDDGAEDGGGAEEETSAIHGALRLVVEKWEVQLRQLLRVSSCQYPPKLTKESGGIQPTGFGYKGKNCIREAQGASGVHGVGVPLPLHLRDALREFERHVVHLRVVIVWRAASQQV